MKITLALIINKASWLIAIVLLGTWIGIESALTHWGDNRLPIQQIINSYTLPSNILFMGNSRVTTGIKPNVIRQISTKSLGYSVQSYNFGVPSTPFSIHYLLLKHLIQQGKQPKTLIYGFVDNELTSTNFFDDASLAQVSEYEDLLIVFDKSLSTLDSRSDLIIKKVSRIYRYRFLIKEVLNRYLTHAQVNPIQLDTQNGGFQKFNNVVHGEAINELINSEKKHDYEKLYIAPSNWVFVPSKTYLEDFIKLAFQAKIKLIFVELPKANLHNQMGEKSIYRKVYFSKLKLYLKNYNIPLYNLSNVELDEHIPDTVHLSDTGATSFTEILFDKVIRPHLFDVRE